MVYVIAVLDVIICVALVILVMMQEGNTNGLGVIDGGAGTFFGHNKARSVDALLKKVTTILVCILVVLTIILNFYLN
ncbi:preprotein translocase subunit SecG [Amygdalobacter nucleatus]|uniref:Protein-export membrane protein SecG n=1 Tax=Amygdalobacter nucleatus TaxID=3029274 RepID=A0A133YED0_9FIRM|nr:preprotein translocase subunit SecG [Amygdalobacter nucleatus]KXB41558.1 preprotein translocase, SecG subunit [Amygdalobacter nucleatus]MDF0485603.1 preprotein translocase subunit SecG [Amygdalobacter nucleatus]